MGNTWNVAATHAAIQDCLDNDAQNGDTIQIASGTVALTDGTGQIDCNGKGVYLKGNGAANTFFTDNITKDGSPASLAIVNLGVNAPQKFWMSDFTFTGVAAAGGSDKGHILTTGSMTKFRAFNITVNTPKTFFIVTNGPFGVLNNITYNDGQDAPKLLFARLESWNGGTFGDTSWATAINWGSADAMYIEDCELNGDGNVWPGTDADAGARLVVRHNTLNDIWVASHGTDSGQRTRGVRQLEIYNNIYNFTTGYAVDMCAWIRGGTGVFTGNTINGSLGGFNQMVKLENLRDGTSYTPFGKCDGTSAYDIALGGGQYRCVDAPGTGTSDDLAGQDPPTSHQPVNNIQDPVYIWNNTNNTNYNPPTFGISGGSLNVQEDRDFYIDGTARPGWTAYTYPHPLTLESWDGGGATVRKTKRTKGRRRN